MKSLLITFLLISVLCLSFSAFSQAKTPQEPLYQIWDNNNSLLSTFKNNRNFHTIQITADPTITKTPIVFLKCFRADEVLTTPWRYKPVPCNWIEQTCKDNGITCPIRLISGALETLTNLIPFVMPPLLQGEGGSCNQSFMFKVCTEKDACSADPFLPGQQSEFFSDSSCQKTQNYTLSFSSAATKDGTNIILKKTQSLPLPTLPNTKSDAYQTWTTPKFKYLNLSQQSLIAIFKAINKKRDPSNPFGIIPKKYDEDDKTVQPPLYTILSICNVANNIPWYVFCTEGESNHPIACNAIETMCSQNKGSLCPILIPKVDNSGGSNNSNNQANTIIMDYMGPENALVLAWTPQGFSGPVTSAKEIGTGYLLPKIQSTPDGKNPLEQKAIFCASYAPTTCTLDDVKKICPAFLEGGPSNPQGRVCFVNNSNIPLFENRYGIQSKCSDGHTLTSPIVVDRQWVSTCQLEPGALTLVDFNTKKPLSKPWGGASYGSAISSSQLTDLEIPNLNSTASCENPPKISASINMVKCILGQTKPSLLGHGITDGNLQSTCSESSATVLVDFSKVSGYWPKVCDKNSKITVITGPTDAPSTVSNTLDLSQYNNLTTGWFIYYDNGNNPAKIVYFGSSTKPTTCPTGFESG